MKLLLKIFAGFFLISLLIVVGYLGIIFIQLSEYPRSKEEITFDRNFERWIDRGGDEITISKLTDFSWNRVCAYGPYAAPEGCTSYGEKSNLEFHISNGGKFCFTITSAIIVDVKFDETECFSREVKATVYIKKEGLKDQKFIGFHDVSGN